MLNQEYFLRKTLPVFINSFNQYHYLNQLVEFLLKSCFANIWIMDNQSTYPPLLDYYDKIVDATGRRVSVFYYSNNMGPHFFHQSGLFTSLWNYPHFYTDPDIIFPELSTNFVTYFLNVSDHFKIAKVAPALTLPEVEDMVEAKICMPETNQMPVSVREWESRFWVDKISENIFIAPVDTTFHLFNPKYFKLQQFYQGLRIAGKGFEAIHRPWFKSDQAPLEERAFYKKTSQGYGGWVEPE